MISSHQSLRPGVGTKFNSNLNNHFSSILSNKSVKSISVHSCSSSSRASQGPVGSRRTLLQVPRLHPLSGPGSVVCRSAADAAGAPFRSGGPAPVSPMSLAPPCETGPFEATLLLQCPDRKGVIAAVTQLLFGFGCNIITSDQCKDLDFNIFFQRIAFDYSDLVVGPRNVALLERAVEELALRFNMSWKVSYRGKLKRFALLVSKQPHCLYDILIRHKSGELRCEIPVVISNHPDLAGVAESFGIPFRHIPIVDVAAPPASQGEGQGASHPEKAGGHQAVSEGKLRQEEEIERVVSEVHADTLVLARYMQVLSPGFCERHWQHTINIHHSFLPAFEGARPYHRAYSRGVKVIGATAHYATPELDAGPIIDQGVARISHRDTVDDMIRKGRDLERMVLANALRWHLDDRVLVHNNKTVVFAD